jgi:hypothetical protein
MRSEYAADGKTIRGAGVTIQEAWVGSFCMEASDKDCVTGRNLIRKILLLAW